MKKFIILLTVIGSFILFFPSCQPVKGADLASTLVDTEITDAIPLFCSEDAVFYETKVLFVVDQTNSNKKSDPNKTIREQNIRNFIEHNENSSVSYGIISFSDHVFSPITLIGNDVVDDIVAFTSNPETIETSLTEMLSKPDKGGGNYVKLLDQVLSEIQDALDFDQRTTSNKIVDYHIVFMSDGNLSVRENGRKNFTTGIKTIVDQFDRVYVHSVYYGDYKNRGPGFAKRVGQGFNAALQLYVLSSGGFFPFSRRSDSERTSSISSRETDDVHHLKSISENGQGTYVDKNEESGLTLDLRQQWHTEPFIVYNLNAGFCLNGTVGLDSDMDGLCDEDEMEMPGFEPYNRFSFADGYGDYFHWLELEQQSSLTPCSNKNDNDHDLLTDCEEEYINSIDSGFPLLSVDNPDSDGDRILDGIEVLVYFAKDPLAARNRYNLDKESDGLSDYDKIVRHISPFISVEEQTAYDTRLVPVEGENGSCYSLRQTKLPLYSTLPVDKDDTLSQSVQKQGDNTLLIYTLKKRKNSDSHVYQFMYRTIYVDSENLHFPVGGNSFRYLAFSNSLEN